MNSSTLVVLVAALVASAPVAASAQKKTLAIVVNGLDNDFFKAMGNGCADWNKTNPNSQYECLYTGPALTSDQAGEIQIVADLIARDDVAGIAISPSTAPAMAKLLTDKQADIKAKKIAIMTIGTDLAPADQGLRATFFGTDNYGIGVNLASYVMRVKPSGGKLCLQLDYPAANSANERAVGFRESIAGMTGIDRLDGQGGWTEIEGCPAFTNGDQATANQQLGDLVAANPDLSALILVDGTAQLAPEAYANVISSFKNRLPNGEMVIVGAGILPEQLDAVDQGLSHVQIGEDPFTLGNKAPDVLIKLIQQVQVNNPFWIDPFIKTNGGETCSGSACQQGYKCCNGICKKDC